MVKIDSVPPKGVYAIKGDYYFDHQRFTDAFGYYRKSVNIKPNNVHSMLRTAEVYVLSGDSELAASWFSMALNADPDIEPEYILKYVFTLVDNKMYDEAREWLEVYKEKLKTTPLTDQYKDSTLYVLQNIGSINSGSADISPVLYNDRLIFNSARSDSIMADGNEGYKLYETTLSQDGQYGDIKLFHKNINAVASDGSISIAPEDETIFFSGNDQSIDPAKTRIYFSDVPEGPDDKEKIRQLSFRDFERNASHPAVNAEGDVIYFVSENEAARRGYDIYRSEGRGRKWDEPKVLSSAINTEGDELYPYLHNDSMLYFTSNGHEGQGGFDIFEVNVLDKKVQVKNLGAPVNSASDDFGLFLNDAAEEGFIVSNRSGGVGDYDIYRLHVMNFKAKVKTSDTPRPNISKPVTISIYASGGNEIRMTGDAGENLKFSVKPGLNYKLFIDKDNYKDAPITTAINTNEPTHKGTSESIDLTNGDEYNFMIKKFVETVIDWDGLGHSTVLKNLQANPGDLVTFRFIPSLEKLEENENPSDTKIAFKDDVVNINNRDTLVIGYVVEEAPKVPAEDTREMLADMDSVPSKSLSMNKEEPDTTLLAENIRAKDEEINNTADSVHTVARENDPEHAETLAEQQAVEETINKTDTTAQPEETTLAADEASASDNSNDSLDIKQALAKADNKAVDEQTPDTLDADLRMAATEMEADSTNELLANSQDETIQPSDTTTRFEEAAAHIENLAKNDEEINSDTKDSLDYSSEEIFAKAEKEDQKTKDTLTTDHQLTANVDDPNSVVNKEINASETERDIQYRVQIAASRVELDDAELRRIYNGDRSINQFTKDGYFKYYIAEVPDYAEANRIRHESGVSDAFIVKQIYDDAEDHSDNTSTELLAQADTASIDRQSTQTDVSEHQMSSNSMQDNTDQLLASNSEIMPGSDSIAETEKMGSVANDADELKVQNNPDSETEAMSVQAATEKTAQQKSDTLAMDQLLTANAQERRDSIDHAQHSSDTTLLAENTQSKDEEINNTSDHDLQMTASAADPNLISNDYVANENKAEQDFRYRVQIAASKTALKDEELKNIYSGDRSVDHFNEEGYFKYYIAEVPSYFTARRILHESGMDKAFIVPYKGNTKWELEDAIYAQYKARMINSGLEVSGSILKIAIVNFEFDEFILLPNERSRLRKSVIDTLKSNEKLYAIVNGHTDIRGSDTYNFGLSEERAMFVRELIIEEGIEPERVETHYFGESQLAKYCDEHENCDESVHQANRRVEVILLEP